MGVAVSSLKMGLFLSNLVVLLTKENGRLRLKLDNKFA